VGLKLQSDVLDARFKAREGNPDGGKQDMLFMLGACGVLRAIQPS
jgi:hypothetical protein